MFGLDRITYSVGLAMGSIPLPCRICKWDEKAFHSRPHFFFLDKNMSRFRPKRDGILRDPIPIGKFHFLVNNETRWDEIYQFHSRPVYGSEIKKCLTLIPKFSYRTKICPNSVSNGMGSRRIPSHREKLPSLIFGSSSDEFSLT